jgi:hypothetical protein
VGHRRSPAKSRWLPAAAGSGFADVVRTPAIAARLAATAQMLTYAVNVLRGVEDHPRRALLPDFCWSLRSVIDTHQIAFDRLVRGDRCWRGAQRTRSERGAPASLVPGYQRHCVKCWKKWKVVADGVVVVVVVAAHGPGARGVGARLSRSPGGPRQRQSADMESGLSFHTLRVCCASPTRAPSACHVPSTRNTHTHTHRQTLYYGTRLWPMAYSTMGELLHAPWSPTTT